MPRGTPKIKPQFPPEPAREDGRKLKGEPSRASTRPHRVDRLDVARFASEGATLQGELALDELPRLRSAVDGAVSVAAGTEAPLVWTLSGALVKGHSPTAAPQVWLHLTGHASVRMACQRCLDAVEVALALKRSFRFVQSDTEAEQLDNEIDDDVLVLHTAFDAQSLIEDEALLALPLVPRHAVCPSPLTATADMPASATAAEPSESSDDPSAAKQAFAALRTAWDRRRTDGGH